MDIEKELNKLFNKVRKSTSIYRVFIKGERVTDKKKKLGELWLVALILLVTYIFILIGTLSKYSNEIFPVSNWIMTEFIVYRFLIGIILMSLLLLPIVIIFVHLFNNIAKMHQGSASNYSELFKEITAIEFSNWLTRYRISNDSIRQYILVYVRDKKIECKKYSLLTFFKSLLPSLAASVPMALLSILFAMIIMDISQGVMTTDELTMVVTNDVFAIVFFIFLIVVIISGFLYTSLPDLVVRSEYKFYERVELSIVSALITEEYYKNYNLNRLDRYF